MTRSVPTPVAHPGHAANWWLILLGIICLGLGLWIATGAVVDIDFMNDNHLRRWPPQVVTEVVVAIVLMGVGPWCLLQGIRKSLTGWYKSARDRLSPPESP
jgi:hypothetical protein